MQPPSKISNRILVEKARNTKKKVLRTERKAGWTRAGKKAGARGGKTMAERRTAERRTEAGAKKARMPDGIPNGRAVIGPRRIRSLNSPIGRAGKKGKTGSRER